MMDVLLLCGYFEPKYQKEISEKTKTWVENAANTFQQRLIAGLKKQDINLQVVSAPFIGSWPTAYKDKAFKGFKAGESTENIQYVPFNNIWGYRNISRTAVLKKSVKEFVCHTGAEKKQLLFIVRIRLFWKRLSTENSLIRLFISTWSCRICRSI